MFCSHQSRSEVTTSFWLDRSKPYPGVVSHQFAIRVPYEKKGAILRGHKKRQQSVWALADWPHAHCSGLSHRDLRPLHRLHNLGRERWQHRCALILFSSISLIFVTFFRHHSDPAALASADVSVVIDPQCVLPMGKPVSGKLCHSHRALGYLSG